MNTELMRWEEEYEVGVESIDRAHEEFFRIIRRLTLLSEEPEKHKWIAKEGIKFLKAYVLNHFSDEEAYMTSIHYGAMEQHFEQHRLLRTKILPRMESHLAHERFSEESINKFLQIMQLWFSRHILIHDKAIGRFTVQ